jgi:hypothetical protein
VQNNPLRYADPTGHYAQEPSERTSKSAWYEPKQFEEQRLTAWYVKTADSNKHPEWFDGDSPAGYEPVISNLYHSVESGKYFALNPFKNESAETDTYEEAEGIYNGYIVNQALGDSPRLPDAVQVSGGALMAGQTYTLDAYGQSFITPLDIYARKPMSGLKFRAGLNFNFLWLDQANIPTPTESRNAFTGPSLTVQGGEVVGGQYQFSLARGSNVWGFGVTTPGAGVVYNPGSYQAVPRHPLSWR